MVQSLLILVFSSALFFFYLQAVCERALRREFSRPFFEEIANAIRLEFPALCDASASSASMDFEDARLAFKCDFLTLSYLLKNAGPARRRLPRREKILLLYFRFLLFTLPIRHAFKLKEKEAVLKLATVLQYFANSVGEKLSVDPLAHALFHSES